LGRVAGRKTGNDAKPRRRVAMAPQVLVNNGDKYGGMYVATKTFGDKDVVSYGDSPSEVKDKASKKGILDPVIFYVPKKGMVSIY
jgi:hypothetical protein